MGPKIVACNMRSSDVKAAPKKENSGGGGGDITVDSELSASSENPVQNKVIYEALNGLDNIFMIESSYTDDATIQAEVYTLNKTFNEIKAAIQDGKICFVKQTETHEDSSTYNYGIVTRLNSSEYSSKINVVNLGIDPLVPLSNGSNNVEVARSIEFSANSGADYPVCKLYYG